LDSDRLPSSFLWGAVTVLIIASASVIREISKRRAWLALPPPQLFRRALFATLLATAVTFGVMLALSTWIYDQPVPPILATFYQKLPLNQQLFNSYINMLIVYVIWVCGYFAVVIQRQRSREEVRRAQLSEALQTAELRLLKSQLNPHFLFNALNGVRALIAEPAAATQRIPVMLLQTLVENAIKHGIAPLRQGGTLRIAARVVANVLIIEVENPRSSQHSPAAYHQGVGLKNASERLRLLFGESGRAAGSCRCAK
jgi:sensor histidine kinase YesM